MDAYGSNWGNPEKKNITEGDASIKKADQKRINEYQTLNSRKDIQDSQRSPQGNIINPNKNDTSVCPHCNNCLSMNNQFQQKVVDTAIRPLPRWIPQSPNLQPFDPFTRYVNYNNGSEHFGNVSFNGIEHFGNKLTVNNAEKLMQLVLYLLIALFILQLFELISKLGEN